MRAASRVQLGAAIAYWPACLLHGGVDKSAVATKHADWLPASRTRLPAWLLAANGGGTNAFNHHSGSPLRLLGLLLACSPAIWASITSLRSRLTVAAARLVLPLAALVPLLATKSVCHRVLQVPGVLAPLADLHMVLNTFQ